MLLSKLQEQRPAAMAGQAIARYRDLVAACSGDDDWNPGVAEPTVGVMRHLFVSETDEEAVTRARQAFAAYHRNLVVLFEKYDVPFAGPVGDPSLGGDADLAMRAEVMVAGSPQTVREHVEATLDAAGTDYFVGAFSWGDLTHRESMRSLDLFTQEVMPHFAAAARDQPITGWSAHRESPPGLRASIAVCEGRRAWRAR